MIHQYVKRTGLCMALFAVIPAACGPAIAACGKAGLAKACATKAATAGGSAIGSGGGDSATVQTDVAPAPVQTAVAAPAAPEPMMAPAQTEGPGKVEQALQLLEPVKQLAEMAQGGQQEAEPQPAPDVLPATTPPVAAPPTQRASVRRAVRIAPVPVARRGSPPARLVAPPPANVPAGPFDQDAPSPRLEPIPGYVHRPESRSRDGLVRPPPAVRFGDAAPAGFRWVVD